MPDFDRRDFLARINACGSQRSACWCLPTLYRRQPYRRRLGGTLGACGISCRRWARNRLLRRLVVSAVRHGGDR